MAGKRCYIKEHLRYVLKKRCRKASAYGSDLHLPLAVMIIAVNTRLLSDDPKEAGSFFLEIFKQLISAYPEHQFYLLFHKRHKEPLVFPSNVHPLIISPAASHPVFLKYWFDIKVPMVLKKINADVFVSPDGHWSLTRRVPQCLVVADPLFLDYPLAHKKNHVRFLKRKTPAFLKKSIQIVTTSEFSKQVIIKNGQADPGKIDVVPYGITSTFQPLSWDAKTKTKEKYTEGSEYFICTCTHPSGDNLITLLKAFSVFKKRMQSRMKLVITGRPKRKFEELLKPLNSYKHKADVIVTGNLLEQELASLIGSAYALVYPSLSYGFELPVVEAMKSEIPVLTSEKTSMQEVGGDAALYFNPNDHADVADKMMMIYRDEKLRAQLIEKGKERVKNFSSEKSAALFWQSILKAVQNNSSI